MTGQGFVFRAVWPITDMATPLDELIAGATKDLPMLAARAHADLSSVTGGRWSVASASRVPGSGNLTANVLLFETPATPRQRRVGCPRCHGQVMALVDSGLCIDCDSTTDALTYEEPAFPAGLAVAS